MLTPMNVYELLLVERLRAAWRVLCAAIDAHNLVARDATAGREEGPQPDLFAPGFNDVVTSFGEFYARAWEEYDAALRAAAEYGRSPHARGSAIVALGRANPSAAVSDDPASGLRNYPADVVAAHFTDGPDTLDVRLRLDTVQVARALLAGWESGAGYWLREVNPIAPPEGSLVMRLEGGPVPLVDYPLSPGGAVILRTGSVEGGRSYRLDREALARGLAILADRYPRRFAAILEGTEDWSAGSALLQCATLGRVEYT